MSLCACDHQCELHPWKQRVVGNGLVKLLVSRDDRSMTETHWQVSVVESEAWLARLHDVDMGEFERLLVLHDSLDKAYAALRGEPLP